MCLHDRYQVDPVESPFLAIKRIMRYLVGTQHLGLWYLKSNTCSLLCCSNSDFVDSRINRKSNTKGCQFIDHSLVSWQCKKQNSVAPSIAKAKYIMTRSCYTQIFWMKQ